MELTCPKCQSPMRQYERNGVHIDQCTECRGIFLDRGELEHLVDAEAAFHQRQPAEPSPLEPRFAPYPNQPAAPMAPQQGAYDPRWAAPQHGYQRYGSPGSPDSPPRGYYKNRRRSFLHDLFD